MKRAVLAFRTWFPVGVLLATLSVQAGTEPVTGDELAAIRDRQKIQFSALKELHQTQTESIEAQIAAVDKRVDDINTHVGQGADRLGVYATIMGILITVLLAGLGLLGFITVTRKTRAEAQDAARAWFEDKATALEKRLQEIESKASVTQEAMERSAQIVRDHEAGAKKSIDDSVSQANDHLQASMGQTFAAPATSEDQAAIAKVQARADELQRSPEDSYSFDDWNTRAHAAYTSKKLEEAALFWKKASQVPNAGASRVAQVLFNRGLTQAQLGQIEAAISTYDELLRHFGEPTEPDLRDQITKAFFNKGVAHGQLGQSEAAIATYDELLRHLGEATEPALRELVAKAMLNKGVTHGRLGQSEAAIATYDELLRYLGEATELALREQVARSMINKGVEQGKLGESEAAIATYDELLRLFGEATEPALRELVATAMFNKGVTHGQLGQSEAKIAICDELLRNFGEATEPALRELVTKAMFNKGVTYGRMGQSEAQAATYDELLRRFGESTEPALLKQVALAHNGIGFMRICEGKRLWATDTARAKSLWQEALGHVEQALARLDPANLHGLIMGNRAYALALLGDTPQAESLFAQALRAPVSGGRELYDGTLSDFDIHPIPQDQPMRELVERQWRIWQAEQGGGSAPPSGR